MNRNKFVASISIQTGVPKKDVEVILDCIRSETIKCMSIGEDINLVGFMKLTCKTTEAREITVPKTGEKKFIESKTVPKARFSVKFREDLKESKEAKSF